MPRPKKENTEVKSKKTKWPKVTEGNHSTRIEHENGRVEFTTHWDKLEKDVKQALRDYENSKVI